MNANTSAALDIATCAWCERPIRSGDPVAQTATVDIVGGVNDGLLLTQV